MRAGSEFRFKHVPEILAVESEHRGTKHAQDPSGLWIELDMVRARYQKPGLKRSVLRIVDFIYRSAWNKYNFCRYTMTWARAHYLHQWPSDNSWPSFLTEAPFPVSKARMFLMLLPTRMRFLGRGVIRQVPLTAPSRAQPAIEEKAA
jgi:hypothetical protein